MYTILIMWHNKKGKALSPFLNMAPQSGSSRRTLRGVSILHICTLSEAGMVPPVTEKIARDNQRVISKNPHRSWPPGRAHRPGNGESSLCRRKNKSVL
jgi:hypothetical protein